MTKTMLPETLYSAYNWTSAAGELEDLRRLKGDDLRAYCAQSAENNRDCGDHDVTELDLERLHDWLVEAKVEIDACLFDVDAVVNLMDDDLREELHGRQEWKSEQEFVDAYIVEHKARFGEDFAVS